MRASKERDLSARVLPDGTSCLVFQRDGAVLHSREVADPWAVASISGPRSGPFDFTLGASGAIMIVQLLPAGARQILGVPMSELADRSEHLDSVVGSVPSEVLDQLSHDAADLDCVRAVERWLFGRMRAAERSSEAAQAVIGEVMSRCGAVRIDELAQEAGLSRRHLNRVVTERVGFSPKLFARIIRFDHAVRLGRMRSRAPWARIALDAGYSDQAHMAREFADLGGISPGELHGDRAATLW